MDNIGISFPDLWHALRRRKLRLLLAAAVGCAIAVAISLGMPVHYTSEALLEVEAHSPLTRELDPGIQATTADQVRTEADILQSRALADTVVRDLNLGHAADLDAAVRKPTWIDWIALGWQKLHAYVDGLVGGTATVADPESNAVALFERRLQVVANEKSHIVTIRLQTGSAKLSADVINDLMAKYLSSQVAANLGVSTMENQWLTEHLAALQHDVDEAAARAQAFRDANGLVDIQAGSLAALQLSEKQQNLSAARQELAKAQAAFDTATTASQTGSGFVGQEALGSSLIQRLREREAEVLQHIANLEQRDGDSSPYMPPVRAELNSIRQQIASETSKIVKALGRDVATARIRVSRLEAMVADSQTQARQNVGAAATLAQLNQEVDAKRHVYNAFLTRMEQTQLTSTKFPAARVVSAAVPPLKPDGVPLPIVAVMGVVAGLFLSIAIFLLRHMLSRNISSAKEMEFLTGVTPIGTMPALPGAGGLPIPMRILDMS